VRKPGQVPDPGDRNLRLRVDDIGEMRAGIFIAGLIASIASIVPSGSLRAQSSSDGREWASAGGKFDADKVLADLPGGYRYEHAMVPMRDGVRLATTVFLPPGEGPWPVILIRTPYERNGGAKYFKGYCAKAPFACVIQDPRGDGDSEGKPLADPVSSDNEIADSKDTLDWIAARKWCNGRIGMPGGSGNGMASAMAYLTKHPNIVVVEPANSAGNTALYWGFENGVRRKLYEWLNQRNLKFRSGRVRHCSPTTARIGRACSTRPPRTTRRSISDRMAGSISSAMPTSISSRNSRRAGKSFSR